MARFDASNYFPVTSDGLSLNVFDSKTKDIRFALSPSRIVTVDASTEANLPKLANDFLGDQSLWWLLLEYNGLLDPIQDIFPGQRLLIPERRQVIAFLEASQTKPESSTIVVV